MTGHDTLIAVSTKLGELEGLLEVIISYADLGFPVPPDLIERARTHIAHTDPDTRTNNESSTA